MRTEQSRIEPNASDPLGHKTGILAGCHAMVDMPAAREHKLAWLLARRSQVIFDRLPCLLGQLELDCPSGLSLPNRCSLNCVAVRRNVLDFEGHHIAAAELAVDGQIEHGEVTDPALDHQLGSDRPNVLWPQRRLGSDQLAFVPGHAGGRSFNDTDSLLGMLALLGCENREHARQHEPPQRNHVSFQRFAVIRELIARMGARS
jgi:hypothetical protein